ncbi:hypothetical protein BBJ28_00000284 [Nothophytophthora sp. Chile5]|nr:hypothetical protein BBJ28_00000284 [Nothophytophthora sp. Chile5]
MKEKRLKFIRESSTSLNQMASGEGAAAASELLMGRWESSEAFGNTALDWSQAVKDQRVRLELSFARDGVYAFRLLEKKAEAAVDTDVTSSFRHVIASQGVYELQGDDRLVIHGDTSGIKWTFLLEEDDSLRIRYASVIARLSITSILIRPLTRESSV